MSIARPLPSAGAAPPPEPASPRWLHRGLILAGLVGLGLRLWQFFANPSLWVDEAALARNVVDRGFRALAGALDYGQVAPPGFLYGAKVATLLFGRSEQVLRLIPLLGGIAALALFPVLARRVLRPVGAIVATALFALAVPLISLSTNFKPYSTDVAVAVGLTLAALQIERSPLSRRSVFGHALLFALGALLSNAAVFVIAGAAVAVLGSATAGRVPDRARRIVLAALWAATAAAVVARARSILPASDRAYLERFWSDGFISSDSPFAWGWARLRELFSGPAGPNPFDGSLHYPWPALWAVLLGIGVLFFVTRRFAAGLILFLPLAFALLASALRLYPSNARLGLFLLPLILLAVVAGAETVAKGLRFAAGEFFPLALLPLAVVALARDLPPWTPEHLRPVMLHVAARARPGDSLWVYYGAGQAFEWYSKSIPFHGRIERSTCDRAEPRALLREVDVARGRPRVWILMAHGSGPFGFDERGMLLGYLGAIGRRLDSFHAPPGDRTGNRAEIALFDLSDPARLASTSVDLYPIGAVPPQKTWTCFGTMSPYGPDPRVVEEVLRASR